MEADDAVAWPFAVGGDIAERWEWLTDGLPPPTGMEQTRKLRHAPRIFLQFEGLESGRNRRRMETLLVLNGGGVWHAPLAIDVANTSAAASSGAASISLDTTLRRFREGGNAIIVDRGNPARYQVLEIETVSPESIGVIQPLVSDWPAGSCIMPTLGATLSESINLARFTGDDVPYSLTFRSKEPLDVSPSFGASSYRGFPVIELPVVWTSDPEFNPARDLQDIDYGTAQPLVYDAAGVVRPRVTIDIIAVTHAEVGAMRSLLYGLSGRWQPIWVASYGQDALVQAVAANDTLDVERMGVCDYSLQTNRRDLRFAMRDGSVFYRRINSAVAIDADTERWVLDDDLPLGFSSVGVACVSFMALCRQDSDTNLLRLWAPGVVTTQLSFVGCVHEF